MPKILIYMAKPRMAPAAREDLREIRRHSKEAFGPEATIRYIEGLRTTAALIAERPLVGASEEDLAKGVRSFGFRSHRIYYQVDADIVTILRVLHHARDVPGAFRRAQ